MRFSFPNFLPLYPEGILSLIPPNASFALPFFHSILRPIPAAAVGQKFISAIFAHCRWPTHFVCRMSRQIMVALPFAFHPFPQSTPMEHIVELELPGGRGQLRLTPFLFSFPFRHFFGAKLVHPFKKSNPLNSTFISLNRIIILFVYSNSRIIFPNPRIIRPFPEYHFAAWIPKINDDFLAAGILKISSKFWHPSFLPLPSHLATKSFSRAKNAFPHLAHFLALLGLPASFCCSFFQRLILRPSTSGHRCWST